MKLYVSDLDGTLLNSQAQLSDYSLRELSRLIEDGLPFTVASARSVISMQSILRGLPLRLPVIEFNGAFVSDLTTGRHLICNAIDRAIVEEIVAMAHAQGILPFVSTFDGQADRLYFTQAINSGMQWYVNDRIKAGDKRLQNVDDLSPHLAEDVVCLTLIERPNVLKPLADEIGRAYDGQIQLHCIENIYSPGWFWLTIHDHRATKAHGLQHLADSHGIDLTDVTVFGDAVNDIPMFEIARRGIAVTNADDQLKEHATAVIGANEDDSVVKYLREDWI